LDTHNVDLMVLARKGGRTLDALLGERIRHRRRARNMSLKDLAESSGISIGLLSQIERGLSSPSLRVLAGLADALQLGLADLFSDSTTAFAQPEKIVVRAGERKQLTFWRTGISKELLTPHADESTLDIFIVMLEPGGTSGSQLYSHEGEEAGTVLEGTIAINVDGKEYRLQAGDSFRFASTRQHSFWNPGAAAARVLWVNARPPQPKKSKRRARR
jgi:transcriptional regulator with XRE-family HTH domain